MSVNIQKIIDDTEVNGIAEIPKGEYEGRLIINKSCTVRGSGSVIWSASGPAVIVNADGVRLENIKTELTSDSLPYDKNVSLYCRPDTVFSDVEVGGAVIGIPGEEQYWGIPKMLSLGVLPAERDISFLIDVYVPVDCEISCDMYGVSVSPDRLAEGYNSISIKTEKNKSGIILYGNIYITSSVTGILRKIIISGETGSADAPAPVNYLLFSADREAPAAYKEMLTDFDPYAADEQDTSQNEYVQIKDNETSATEEINENGFPDGIREENVYITANTAVPLAPKKYCIELAYSSAKAELDIEGYMFMLGENGRVRKNSAMIFFGNDHSECGSIYYLNNADKRAMVADFGAIPDDVKRMVLFFSIYGDSPTQKFDMLVGGEISILCENGVHMHFMLEKDTGFRTILALGFDKKDGVWELITSGKGVAMPLEDICRSYGVTII